MIATFHIPVTELQGFMTELNKAVDLDFCLVQWDADRETVTVKTEPNVEPAMVRNMGAGIWRIGFKVMKEL